MIGNLVRLSTIMDEIFKLSQEKKRAQEIILYRDAGGQHYTDAMVMSTNFSHGKFRIRCNEGEYEISVRDIRELVA